LAESAPTCKRWTVEGMSHERAIAGDDAITRLMFQRADEHQSHARLVAQDGLEAWQLFQVHKGDVVISDWLMPLVDGIEL
jgi:two-component system chemotaxis response regulator CheY